MPINSNLYQQKEKQKKKKKKKHEQANGHITLPKNPRMTTKPDAKMVG
jgi:hypothetical protein